VQMNKFKFPSQSQFIVLLHILLIHLALFVSLGFAGDVAYLLLAGWSVRLKNWQALHLTIAMLLFRRLRLVLPAEIENFFAAYMLLVLIASWVILFAFKKGHLVSAWLKKGLINRTILYEIGAISVTAALTLIAWGYWSDNLGAGESLIKSLATIPNWVVLSAVLPMFAILNAFSEEAFFRGIFQEAALSSKFSEISAIILQALPFAAFHYSFGFPNGKMGYAMTFVYACSLGFLRKQSKGLLAPYIAHITADLVIAYFLFLHSA